MKNSLLSELKNGFLIAFTFMTNRTSSVKFGLRLNNAHAARAQSFLPLIGAIQGALLYVFLLFAVRLFSESSTLALLLVFALCLLSGFLYFSAFVSAADSFSGSGDNNDRLFAMRDKNKRLPAIAAGVFYILFLLLLMKKFIELDEYVHFIALFPVFSAFSINLNLASGGYLQGKTFTQGSVHKSSAAGLLVSLLFVLAASAVFILVFYESPLGAREGMAALFLASALSAVAVRVVSGLRIGGVSEQSAVFSGSVFPFFSISLILALKYLL